MPDRRAHTEAEIHAAVEVLSDPARLDEAQRVVGAAAPQLQQILDQALHEAGWFDTAHQAQVVEATEQDDAVAAVQRLISEETRLSMLIGVAVGYELAHVLNENQGEG